MKEGCRSSSDVPAPPWSAPVFDEEVTDDLLHELQLRLPRFINLDPEASMKSSVQIFRNQKIQCDKLDWGRFRYVHSMPPHPGTADLSHQKYPELNRQ